MSYKALNAFGASEAEDFCVKSGGAYEEETNCCKCILDNTFLDLENEQCVSTCPDTYEERTGSCGTANVCVSSSGKTTGSGLNFIPSYTGQSGSTAGIALLAALVIGVGAYALLG